MSHEIVTEWETTTVTECCEVEPNIRITGETSCPDCGTFDARTINGKRVKDRYVAATGEQSDALERVASRIEHRSELSRQTYQMGREVAYLPD